MRGRLGRPRPSLRQPCIAAKRAAFGGPRPTLREPCIAAKQCVGWASAHRLASALLTKSISPRFGGSHIASPVDRQQTGSNVAMKARIGPVADTTHPAVLDRVEVDVVEMSLPIIRVSDQVPPSVAARSRARASYFGWHSATRHRPGGARILPSNVANGSRNPRHLAAAATDSADDPAKPRLRSD